MSTDETSALRTAAPWWIVALVTAPVVAITLIRFGSYGQHMLATCAVLAVASVFIRPRATPALIAPRRWLAIAGPGVAGLVAWIAAMLIGAYLQGPPVQDYFLMKPVGVLVVLTVPIAEEAFFRGALLRAWPSRPVLSAMGSSLLFGALHLPLGLTQAGLMAIGGLALAAIALKTRSWAIPAVVHASFNALATAYQSDVGMYMMLPLVWVVVLPVAGILYRRREA